METGTEYAKITCGRAHFDALAVRESRAHYVAASDLDGALAQTSNAVST